MYKHWTEGLVSPKRLLLEANQQGTCEIAGVFIKMAQVHKERFMRCFAVNTWILFNRCLQNRWKVATT